MEHTDRRDNPKIVRECAFPLTATQCVSMIVTDIAVTRVTLDSLLLTEVAPGWTASDVQALTEPTLVVSGDLGGFRL